jgi:uncharacterized protein
VSRLRHGLLSLIVTASLCAALPAAEMLHPRPARHFNDYANLVSRATAEQLDRRLAQFERDTSNQLVVAIYPRMDTDSSVEDYTVRLAEKWGVGQKQRNNGAVLFVFKEQRQLYISVGYGLEGALPDATAHQIVENELKPAFRSGNFDAGLTRAVNAMMAATRGEYQGTGRTQGERGPQSSRRSGTPLIFFIVLFIIFGLKARRSRGHVYGNPRRWGRSGGWYGSGGSWGGFGGSSGGGGGGGFSGGGGSFGGGGAGGRW